MAKKKQYTYNPILEGSTIWASKKIEINEKVSQKDLEELYKLGVKGIEKVEQE